MVQCLSHVSQLLSPVVWVPQEADPLRLGGLCSGGLPPPVGGQAASRMGAGGGLSCEGGADTPAGLQGLKQGDRQRCPELGRRLPPGGGTSAGGSAPSSRRRVLRRGPAFSTRQPSGWGVGNPGLGRAPGPRTGVSAAGLWLTALSLSTAAGCRAEGGEKRKPEAEVSSSVVGTCAWPRASEGGRGSRLHERGGALGRPSGWWSSDPSSKTRRRGSPEILDTPASWVPAEEEKQTPLPPFLPSLVSDSYLKVLFLPQGEDWFTRVVKLSLPKRFSVNVGTVTITFQDGAFSGRVIGGDPFVCLSGEVAQPKAVWRFGSS